MPRFAITDPRSQDAADKQAVLEAIFSVVANPRDWKAPIDVEIADHPTLLEMIADAVVHFTATSAVFTPVRPGRVRVVAAGYRAGPAGP